MSIFVEISLLLVITAGISVIIKLLKQPLIVGYILSGILVGPYFLNILNSKHELELFSQIGIVFLLFIVGLYLNPTVIKEVGKVSLVTGIGQVLFTSTVGFIISMALGIDKIAALYISIALTFSSTIIILKLLADKKDLQKLYAKIAIGFLLVQDVLATIILIGVTVFSSESNLSLGQTIAFTLIKGFFLLIVLYFLTNLVIKKLIKFLAHSQELLFLFSLAWGIGMATIFSVLGFSIEIGALVAGVSLSRTAFVSEMSARLKPLRDFFIVIFFVLLGSQMILSNIQVILLPAIILSVFVLVGNPIIVIILMNLLGYKRRTGFLAGLTVAQISEFSLILAALGMRVGHLSQEILSLITLVGLITISGSTYLIIYSEKFYPKVVGWLKYFELIKNKRSEKGVVEENYSNIIFGYDRVGSDFVKTLKEVGGSFLVVDFNPDSIEKLDKEKIPYRYGDAGDVEFLEELPVSRPKIIVSTIPDLNINILIIREMKIKNSKVKVITIANTVKEAKELYINGAAYVIMPHHLGAKFATKLIRKCGFDLSAYKNEKEKHLSSLEN